jgi:hypothetical protein
MGSAAAGSGSAGRSISNAGSSAEIISVISEGAEGRFASCGALRVPQDIINGKSNIKPICFIEII